MDNVTADICGEITALRFILRVMLVNELIRRPDGEEVLLRFATDVDRKLRFGSSAPLHADAATASAIQDASIAAATRFFQSAADLYGELA